MSPMSMSLKRKLYENKESDLQIVTYYPNWWDAYRKNRRSQRLLHINQALNYYGEIDYINIDFRTCVVDFKVMTTTFDEVPVAIQIKVNVSPPKREECFDKYFNSTDTEVVKDEDWYIEKYSAMFKFYNGKVNTEQELRKELESLLTFFDGVPYRVLKTATFSNNSSEIAKVRGLVAELEQHSSGTRSERTIREFEQLITQVDNKEDLLSIIKKYAEEKLKQYYLIVRECSISVKVKDEVISEVGRNAIQSFNLIYSHDQNEKARLAFEADQTSKAIKAEELKFKSEHEIILMLQEREAGHAARIQVDMSDNKHSQALNRLKKEANETLGESLALKNAESLVIAQSELDLAEAVNPVMVRVYDKKMSEQLERYAIDIAHGEGRFSIAQREIALGELRYEQITKKEQEIKKKEEADLMAIQTARELMKIDNDAAIIKAMAKLPAELPDKQYTAEQVSKVMEAKLAFELEEISGKIASFRMKEAMEKEVLSILPDIIMEEYRLAESVNQQALLLDWMRASSLERDAFIKGLGDSLSKVMQGVKDMNPTITWYGNGGENSLNPLNALKEFSQFSEAAVPLGKMIKETLEKIMTTSGRSSQRRPTGTRSKEKDTHNGTGLNGEMTVSMDEYNNSDPDLSDIA